jgi:hypothetical protein
LDVRRRCTCHDEPMEPNAGSGSGWRCVIRRRAAQRRLEGTPAPQASREAYESRSLRYSIAGFPQRYTFRTAETRDRAAEILHVLVDELVEKERREREMFNAAVKAELAGAASPEELELLSRYEAATSALEVDSKVVEGAAWRTPSELLG